MPKLRTLAGKEVIAILESFGFSAVRQRGSHVTMRRVVAGSTQSLTVPNHTSLDRGTSKAIYNQASRYIPADQLHPFFYTD